MYHLLAVGDRPPLRGGVADGHRHEPLDAVRVQGGEDPGHGGAPVVADDTGLLDLERVEDRDEVGDGAAQAVRLDRGRPVGRAEAAHVRRDRPQPGVRERVHLVAPQMRRVREAVHEQDRRRAALALVADLELDPVAADAHGGSA
jgi:hypothetical protein